MSEPIRVLNLFTIMNRGGAETMVMNYYRQMDRSKVQFDFLVHREERGAYDDEIESLGGHIYRTMPLYPQNFMKYKRYASQFLEEHSEYQIIHSHMSESGYFVLKEAHKRGIPVRICHAHNAAKGWDIKMFVRCYFKHRIRRHCTHMFACGYEAGEWLFGRKNRDRLIIQRNAIDAVSYDYNITVRERIRKELNIQNKVVIGHVGRFSEQKNHDFLIDIFAAYSKKEKNSVLILVGDGQLIHKTKEKVERLGLNDRVIFLGMRENVNELLQAFDFVVFPSLFEGLSVAIVEAQAAGLPCLLSDSIPEECKITDNVWFYGLNQSPERWADRMVEIQGGFYRKSQLEEIQKAGFDVHENARWLERFYLGSYEKQY